MEFLFLTSVNESTLLRYSSFSIKSLFEISLERKNEVKSMYSLIFTIFSVLKLVMNRTPNIFFPCERGTRIRFFTSAPLKLFTQTGLIFSSSSISKLSFMITMSRLLIVSSHENTTSGVRYSAKSSIVATSSLYFAQSGAKCFFCLSIKIIQLQKESVSC